MSVLSREKNYLCLSVLSSDSAWSATAEWGGGSEINVLFSVNSDQERGNVDELLADSKTLVRPFFDDFYAYLMCLCLIKTLA